MVGIAKATEPDGTLTVSENGTACAPGVMVVMGAPAVEANEQAPPGGSVAGEQESLMGCPGAPVFAFNRRVYVADAPGETV